MDRIYPTVTVLFDLTRSGGGSATFDHDAESPDYGFQIRGPGNKALPSGLESVLRDWLESDEGAKWMAEQFEPAKEGGA